MLMVPLENRLRQTVELLGRDGLQNLAVIEPLGEYLPAGRPVNRPRTAASSSTTPGPEPPAQQRRVRRAGVAAG